MPDETDAKKILTASLLENCVGTGGYYQDGRTPSYCVVED